jgi:hypothetical protein
MDKGNYTLQIQEKTHPTIPAKYISPFILVAADLLTRKPFFFSFLMITNPILPSFYLYTLFGPMVTSVSGTSL